MAAYNAAATIDQSIASVLAQSRQDFELIVVDDGSTDDTAQRVSKYASDPRIRLHRQANAGPCEARNSAIKLARGEYVAILDSDDLWLPHYLAQMVAALEEVPRAGIAYTRAWMLDRAANRLRRDTWPERLPQVPPGDSRALLHALVLANFICSSVTARRSVLEHVGGYDPWVAVAEDFELWLRIAAAGYGGTQVSGPLVIRSDRPDSLSKDALAMCAGKKRAFQRLLERVDLDPEVDALARSAVVQLERGEQLLSGRRRRTPAEFVRKLGGRATRPLRRRTRQRATPPPEVARWFPGLGTGRDWPATSQVSQSTSASSGFQREHALR
jgi:glycosyltransferase involved in cell wall biosynthesis